MSDPIDDMISEFKEMDMKRAEIEREVEDVFEKLSLRVGAHDAKYIFLEIANRLENRATRGKGKHVLHDDELLTLALDWCSRGGKPYPLAVKLNKEKPGYYSNGGTVDAVYKRISRLLTKHKIFGSFKEEPWISLWAKMMGTDK